MLPHYPASSEWATVGGYVAARGSGVLSTRYGKIEDLLLSLRVVLASGELIETVQVPRHAVGPELTQLFVGSEGTLGIITQVTLQVVPLPAVRRFATVRFPSIGAGVDAIRRALAVGVRPSVDPHVRRRGHPAGALARGRRAARWRLHRALLRGRAGRRRGRGGRARWRSLTTPARPSSTRGLAETWWDRRYDFYVPPHQPVLPIGLGHDRRGGHLRARSSPSTTRCAPR